MDSHWLDALQIRATSWPFGHIRSQTRPPHPVAASILLLASRIVWLHLANGHTGDMVQWLARWLMFLCSLTFNNRPSCQYLHTFWSLSLDWGYLAQSTFCINSVAHWIGTTPYDDVQTPRDHFLSALLTMGEGYHNFHHQFPMDYRNAYLWYQYDPTKWFIALCGKIGLASHLRVFPSNEIAKCQLAMKLKDLKQLQDSIEWPTSVDKLPVVTWETCQCSFSFV